MSEQNVYLSVKDHSVSKEEFRLIENPVFGFLETVPQPSVEALPNYYQSEDYISHTDTQRNLFERIYHVVRSIALKKKLTLIHNLKTSGKQLLDVGCGTGDFLQVAKTAQWNVTGIEPNEGARLIANEKVDGAVFDVSELWNLKPQTYDVITLWHVLEHLPNLESHVERLKQLLKPDGVLVIAVPNYKSYDAHYYKSYWAAYDVPRHLWHFSKNAIQKLFQKYHMKVEAIKPMLFDAYYVSLLSEKYKSGWMNFFNATWIGWRSNWKAKRSKEYSSLIYILKNTK